MFEGLLSGDGKSSIVEVLEKLLDPVDIQLKTDLNINQIRVLTQLKWYSELDKPENRDKDAFTILMVVMDYYLQLMTSLKRKSRGEVVEAIKEMSKELAMPDSLIGGMFPKK